MRECEHGQKWPHPLYPGSAEKCPGSPDLAQNQAAELAAQQSLVAQATPGVVAGNIVLPTPNGAPPLSAKAVPAGTIATLHLNRYQVSFMLANLDAILSSKTVEPEWIENLNNLHVQLTGQNHMVMASR